MRLLNVPCILIISVICNGLTNGKKYCLTNICSFIRYVIIINITHFTYYLMLAIADSVSDLQSIPLKGKFMLKIQNYSLEIYIEKNTFLNCTEPVY